MTLGSRWARPLGVAVLFTGVCLVAAGIGLILRSDFIHGGDWTVILLPPILIIFGTVLVFLPVFRWFHAESRASQAGGEQRRG